MFHSLHCLNSLRRELDREYYSQHGGVYHWKFPQKLDRIHMGKADYSLNGKIRSVMQVGTDGSFHQIIASTSFGKDFNVVEI